jgi:hypothetical protein
MYKLEIVDVDGELGVVFPDDLAAKLNLTADKILIATSDSYGFRLAIEHSSEGKTTSG